MNLSNSRLSVAQAFGIFILETLNIVELSKRLEPSASDLHSTPCDDPRHRLSDSCGAGVGQAAFRSVEREPPSPSVPSSSVLCPPVRPSRPPRRRRPSSVRPLRLPSVANYYSHNVAYHTSDGEETATILRRDEVDCGWCPLRTIQSFALNKPRLRFQSVKITQ